MARKELTKNARAIADLIFRKSSSRTTGKIKSHCSQQWQGLGKIAMNINLNEKQSQSQNARILAHLKNGERITSLDALNQFGCLRLSARIKDLRDRGHAIHAEFIEVSSGKRVKQYFMVGAV